MELRALREEDLERAWELSRDAFHAPLDYREGFFRVTDPTRFVGAFDGDRLVALAGAHGLGQYFGARSVPMGGLASVSVAPDWRGRGVARRVIEQVIRAMAERGDLVSSLFPAMTHIYRSLGWELGGSTQWRKLTPDSLAALPRPEAGRLRPWTTGDVEAMRRVYDGFARSVDGCLDRPDRLWSAKAERWQECTVYVAESAGGAIEGYLVYRQIDGEYSGLGGPFGLVVDEIVSASRDAALGLWRLIGSWSGQVDQILYRSTPEEPLFLLLPEQGAETLAEIRWMTRLIDARGAVAARGFRPGAEGQVSLALRDPLLPDNEGDFVLSLKGGEGCLEPGGEGAVRLEIGGFSSLYTGWATTATLARAGLLAGGTQEQRALLDAAFAGPTPWMLDEF
jgi:predicted acetyltransferase